MIIQDRMTVTSQQQIAHNIFEMKLNENWSGKFLPGPVCPYSRINSFEPLLRRPISIASIDEEAGK